MSLIQGLILLLVVPLGSSFCTLLAIILGMVLILVARWTHLVHTWVKRDVVLQHVEGLDGLIRWEMLVEV